MGRKAKIEKTCTVCGVLFLIPPCRDWREHECSSDCKVAARVARSKALMKSRSRACERCGGAFVVKKSQIDSGHGKFCSQSCAMKTFTETDAFKAAMAKSGETYKANLRAGKFVRAKGADHPQWTGGLKAAQARRVGKLTARTGRASVPGRFSGSIARLVELLELRADTGILLWKRNGNRAGSLSKNGYRHVRVDGTLVPEHRIIFAIAHGVWPSNQIDHINGVPSDNRVANLRDATPAENARNTKAHFDNRSGFKGVTMRSSKFRAHIWNGKRSKYLGSFSRPEDANAAYANEAAKIFGSFARAR